VQVVGYVAARRVEVEGFEDQDILFPERVF
jgi:hypothetical protein